MGHGAGLWPIQAADISGPASHLTGPFDFSPMSRSMHTQTRPALPTSLFKPSQATLHILSPYPSRTVGITQPAHRKEQGITVPSGNALNNGAQSQWVNAQLLSLPWEWEATSALAACWHWAYYWWQWPYQTPAEWFSLLFLTCPAPSHLYLKITSFIKHLHPVLESASALGKIRQSAKSP